MYKEYIPTLIRLLEEAAKKVFCGFSSSFEVTNKEDGSPVTNIDKEVDLFLRNELAKSFPTYGFLTEESKDDLSRLDKDYIWVIDPIDGTEEFVRKEYEFTINVALVYKHEVVLGFVAVPLKNEIYYAYKNGGAYLYKNNENKRLHVSNKTDNLIVLVSPFHNTQIEEDYINKHQEHIKEVRKAGAAYKACLIASNEADVTYRFSCHNKEWDVAAPDIIVSEAGGLLLNGDGSKITYNKKDVTNHTGYVIVNKIDNLYK